jgi:bacteriorhodopsin
MANHALDLNPPNANIHISTHASDWLWAAFSLITLGLLTVIVLNFLVCATIIGTFNVV